MERKVANFIMALATTIGMAVVAGATAATQRRIARNSDETLRLYRERFGPMAGLSGGDLEKEEKPE